MKGIRRFKRVLITAGAIGAVFSYSQVHKINDKLAYIKKKLETNGALPIKELSTKESAMLPWEFKPESLEKDDWEFRRVQVKGGLFGTRHLVRRDKGDRPGYLVFAAMPTAQHVVKEVGIPMISEATIGAQTGIIVCLGWVPLEAIEKVLDTNMVQKDIVLLDELYKDAKKAPIGIYRDPFTGFMYNKEIHNAFTYPPDSFDEFINPDIAKARTVLGEALHPTTEFPSGEAGLEDLPADSEMNYWGEPRLPTFEGYYNIKGYLRKGEEDDWLLGRVNKGIRNVNKVDVAKIAGFYRFRNPSAYEYYLDRSTDDQEEYDNLLPQPNHLNKGFEHLEPFEKDSYYEGYKKMAKISSLLAIVGLLI